MLESESKEALCKQGSFRHFVLDLLQCAGMDVQKNMHLPVITHVVAADVHDQKSAKLEAARLCVSPLSP